MLIEFELQGVRAKQVKAVNEIPTPYGVADLPTKQVGSLTGVSLTAFLFSHPCRTPHESKHLNRGGAEGKRSQYVERLGGSSRTIWSAGRIIKPRGRRYTIRHMMIHASGVKHLPSLLRLG